MSVETFGAQVAPTFRRWIDSDKALAAICVIVPLIGLFLFFIYPMIIVFIRSITTPDGTYGLANYAQILFSKGFWRATQHSLVMGGTTTVLSVGLGFIIALGLHRCAFPGKTSFGWRLCCRLSRPPLCRHSA